MKKGIWGAWAALLIALPVHSQELLRSIEKAHVGAAQTVAINAEGSVILTGGDDNRAYLWDAKTGKKIKALSHSNKVSAVDFHANGKLFVTGALDNRLIIFDAKEGKPKKLLKGHQGAVRDLAFNPLGEQLASSSADNTIRIWNTSTGQTKNVLRGHSKAVNSIAYSPDGKKLASGSDDNTVKIWNLSDGQIEKTLEARLKGVKSVAWSSDGRYLATGGSNGIMVIWDANTGKKITEIAGHRAAVNSLTFSPDVQYLASAGDDNQLIIWEMKGHNKVKGLTADTKGVNDLDFDDKGKVLISVGKSGGMKIWDVGELQIGKKKFVKDSGDPKLVCSPMKLKDSNGNGIIESHEKVDLHFTIRNQGKGQAYNLVANLEISQEVSGLSFLEEMSIGNLNKNGVVDVTIPITVTKDIATSSATFTVRITEANGHNPAPLNLSVQTKGSSQYSYIMILDHAYSSATGKAEIGAPITLKLKLQNTSKGQAKDVKVVYKFPPNVMAVDKLSENIPSLAPGEIKTVEVQFFANPDFKEKEIKVGLDIEGSAFSNAKNVDLTVAMNESLPQNTGFASEEMAESSETKGDDPVYRGGGDPLKGLNVASPKSMIIGDYYALIIGIDAYAGSWTPLNNAVSDAKAVENMLRQNYKFDHFRTLYNAQATRANIIQQMEWLLANVREEDNVFIYYSGHGEFKQTLNKGYWVPVDAGTKSTSQYISNSDIQTFLGGIRSKHTLLVSDACFSGDIFRGNTVSVPFEQSEKYYREVHSLVSRQAITSGGVEPVMDGGRDGHSVFAYYLLKSLSTNSHRYFDAGQLYSKLKIPVINNSEQTPRFSPVKNTGDEGGQFIFIRK